MALRIHNPSGGTRNEGMPAFVGATTDRDGRAGAVPAPLAGQELFVLKGDGNFGLVNVTDTFNFLGQGTGTYVSVQDMINAIIQALQNRTVWHYLDGSSGPGSGGGSSGGSAPTNTTLLVDTYGITGSGAGQTVSSQNLVDAVISRYDTRTSWHTFGNEEESVEESSENTDENDGINLNEESSGNDLYDQIQNNYEENNPDSGSSNVDPAAE